jgi:two-component system nitrate/nitrite sensor histidine kinase NarX
MRNALWISRVGIPDVLGQYLNRAIIGKLQCLEVIILQIIGKLLTPPGNIGNLGILKIVTIVSPALLILVLEFLRSLFFEEAHPIFTFIFLFLAAVIFTVFYSRLIFNSVTLIKQSFTRRSRELNILYKIALSVNESLALNTMLPQTMQNLIQETGADSGDLFLIDENSRELLYTLHVGLPTDKFKLDPSLLMQEGLISGALQTNEPLLIPNTGNSSGPAAAALLAAGFHSLAIIPLKSKNSTLGIFGLLSFKPDCFKPTEAKLFSNISSLISAAIENARRYEKVQAMAVAEERDRISRELHDGLAQVLGFVITRSQATRQILRKISVANDYLVELENVAQDIYTDTREDILGLRTAISGDRDMVSAMREYLKRFSQMHGIKTSLEVGDQIIPSLSPQVELQAIRIMQEALSNIRKHAEATQVWVKFTAGTSQVALVVEDDGKGFDINKLRQDDFSKFGIRTSRERAESIHSKLDIESSPEHGTKVTLSIPLDLPQSSAEKGEESESTDS